MSTKTRIVVKLGTGLVVNSSLEFNKHLMSSIAQQIKQLNNLNVEIVLVCSGAIALGKKLATVRTKELNTKQRQALAAIGQPHLISYFSQLFDKNGQTVSQILVTPEDLSNRKSYLNLKNTIEELLLMNSVPIVNENDCLSIDELVEDKSKNFGDNDVLSALVAAKLDADRLIILTNVDGIYTGNPEDKNSSLIKEIENLDALKEIQGVQKSEFGRGGVQTKILAAKIASLCGVKTYISNGNKENILIDIFNNKDNCGTVVRSLAKINSKKKWIGFSKSISGVVTINEGAQQALEDNQSSLLPVGIVDAKGSFKSDELVSVVNESGLEVARGISNYSAKDLQATIGKRTREIKDLLPNIKEEFIHRDSLVIFKELYNELSE